MYLVDVNDDVYCRSQPSTRPCTCPSVHTAIPTCDTTNSPILLFLSSMRQQVILVESMTWGGWLVVQCSWTQGRLITPQILQLLGKTLVLLSSGEGGRVGFPLTQQASTSPVTSPQPQLNTALQNSVNIFLQ
ncbi:hypothetical protein E2C01_060302 [Portunus trituberculatus]|uniref:Uncharacterized protein n=1 Tax=Portunus trituberculatus TaxID=210409 RepID=A0A5B7HA34_PORTR|nr:hypothetical protein [Portunus trituberculatus]